MHHAGASGTLGEELPRWAWSAYWRKDGQPMWRNPDLFADPATPGTQTADDAAKILQTIAEKLGIDQEFTFPAYEDLGIIVGASDNYRAMLTSNHDFPTPVNEHVSRTYFDKVLVSELVMCYHSISTLSTKNGKGKWFLREEHCFLMPGDSPLGFRLPLDSLPWSLPEDQLHVGDIDPSAPEESAPKTQKKTWPHQQATPQPPEHQRSAKNIVRPPSLSSQDQVFYESFSHHWTRSNPSSNSSRPLKTLRPYTTYPCLIEGYQPPLTCLHSAHGYYARPWCPRS